MDNNVAESLYYLGAGAGIIVLVIGWLGFQVWRRNKQLSAPLSKRWQRNSKPTHEMRQRADWLNYWG